MPSLQRACERAVARQLVEPRSVCGVLLYADAAGASMLRRYCLVRAPELAPCHSVLPAKSIWCCTLALLVHPCSGATAWCGCCEKLANRRERRWSTS